jgi:hypothetical protein
MNDLISKAELARMLEIDIRHSLLKMLPVSCGHSSLAKSDLQSVSGYPGRDSQEETNSKAIKLI